MPRVRLEILRQHDGYDLAFLTISFDFSGWFVVEA